MSYPISRYQKLLPFYSITFSSYVTSWEFRWLNFKVGILKFHHFVTVIFHLSFENKNKLKFYFIIENVASQYPFFRIKLPFIRNFIKFIVNRYFYSIMDSFYFLRRITTMKDIKIPIISGLSIAATLALMPMQALADNAKATVTGGGSDGVLHTPGGGYYSGGYEGAGNGGGSKNHIVTITGSASGTDMSGYSIYGGGMGHPSITPTTSADRNQITVQNRATVTTVIGGEGKGATGNTVNIINATVNRVVLGGNGTWAGKPGYSGNAVGNTVNIEGNSHIIGDNNTVGSFEAIVSGGRARYGRSA